MNWLDLDFWNSPECKAVMEKIDAASRSGKLVNPLRDRLFAAMDATPFHDVRVCIIGQDPYPDSRMSTGIGFSIPSIWPPSNFPASLKTLFDEYHRDLGYPYPTSGDLTPWCKQGVFLWNACPTCYAAEPGSHSNWPEWKLLTREIIEKLNGKGIVFVFFGAKARAFAPYVNNYPMVLEYAHPSPLGQANAKTPFKGSRMFSTINAWLHYKGRSTIDWRLP
jgi:uracil-DNA glycosylase